MTYPLHTTRSHWIALPVGALIPYAGLLADTDTGGSVNLNQIKANLAASGWLSCDGASYFCADYKHLHGVIGDSFGGDGGTRFNVPDLRGRFLRGVNGAAENDPDAATRIASAGGGATGNHVGSLQADALQGHEHQYTATQQGTVTAQPGGPDVLMQLRDQATTSIVADQADDGTPRISTETRPVNLALNFIIRAG